MRSHTGTRLIGLPTAPHASTDDAVARAGRLVPERLRQFVLATVIALVAIAGGAGLARADTVHCPDFAVSSVQWIGGRYHQSTTQVQRVSADGLSCAEVRGLFRSAYVSYSGGGGDTGVQWGPPAHAASQPRGWSVKALAEYSRIRHPSTLDWIVGWKEQLSSRRRWIRFTQGQITRYALNPRY